MATKIGSLLFIVFLFLSSIHFYWGLGGTWGLANALPQTEGGELILAPGALGCFVVAAGLLGLGLFILVKINVLPILLPSWLKRYGLYMLAAIFVLRAIGDFYYVGFFKQIASTPFGHMDTILYSPLCLAIGALSLLLERLLRRKQAHYRSRF